MNTRIYLDHAATAPCRPEARAAMEEGFSLWANPSSPHAAGRAARAALEDARDRVKAALGWQGEVIFTSGASEAAAIAMNRAQADRRIVTAVEHDCVHQAAPDAFHLPVDQAGIVEERALREALGDDRAIVAIQAWNSETGVAQPVERQASIVHEAGGLLLVDAAQSAGKAPLPAGADMVITSAHKLGGPVGIGALLVKDYAMLDPSGGHERGYRRGTENLPGALGFAAALEAIGSHYLPGDVARGMPALLKERLVPAGAQIVPQASDPNPHIIALSMPGLNASAQVMRFDMAGIAVSQGSACSSGTMKTSRVLSAMRVDEDIARNTIRISPGWNTTFADLEQFCDTWLKMARSA